LRDRDKLKTKCPFVENPSEECYVARMDSGAVEKALRFCRGIYEKCDIYLKRTHHKEAVREEMKSTQKTKTEQRLQPILRTDKEGR